MNRLLGDLPGSVLVHVIHLAALLVDDAVRGDAGPDHGFYSFEALSFSEVEREADFCEAELCDG